MVKTLLSKYPALLVAIFTLCWAAVELIGGAADVSAYQVVWTRYGVHLAFMLVVFGPRHGKDLVRTSSLRRQIVASLLMLGMPLCFIWGLERLPVRDESAAVWIAPSAIVALSIAIGWPSGGKRTIFATVIGFIGAMLICSPDADVFRRAALLGVGAGLCLALYVIVVRAMHQEKMLAKLFHTALWVWLALTAGLPLYWRMPGLRGMLAMAAIGLSGLGGLFALDLAIDAMPVAFLAPVLYSQLVWGALLEHAAGNFPIDKKTALGIVLASAAAIPALLRRGPRATADDETSVHVATA